MLNYFDIITPLEDMNSNYKIVKEWTGEAKMLADEALAASQQAVADAFAAGLSITVAKDGNIVRIAPDGTETVIKKLAVWP